MLTVDGEKEIREHVRKVNKDKYLKFSEKLV